MPIEQRLVFLLVRLVCMGTEVILQRQPLPDPVVYFII
jgi:hypothetical protein